MKIIKFILLFSIFVLTVLVAHVNHQEVHFSIPFIGTYALPLIFLLFISFVMGALLGIFSMLFRILSLRKALIISERKLRKARHSIELLSPQRQKPDAVVVDDSSLLIPDEH
ncbi:MAG: LapA family protein [Neisseriaceae bacterium]